MPDNLQLLRLAPEIVLSVCGALVMVLDAVLSERRKFWLAVLSLLGIYTAGVATLAGGVNPGSAFGGMIRVDAFAGFFRLLVCGIGFLIILGSMDYLERHHLLQGEYCALVLFSLTGQCLMAVSDELIMIFLGLEISSISTYVLAGFRRDDGNSSESALKYFFLGSFATAFLLYGVALIYGAVGSTRLPIIRKALERGEADAVLLAVASGLLFVGLGFKVSAAPFQVWTPDVYQGAPSPVAAFLSTGPKAAAFAVLLRVFLTALPQSGPAWLWMLWMSALLSMTIGNFAALVQTNVKRLLGYSSIAHAGYVLVAVAARSEVGAAAAMFYLAAYGFMNVGAFLVVSHLSGPDERYVTLDDYAGLGHRRPVVASLLAIFLLSLVGIPLTGGFFGKFYIFRAAIQADLIWLAVLGLLNSAVAAYYYLKILVVMYMREPAGETPFEPLPASLATTLIFAALGVLALGVIPGPVLDFATRAAR